MGSEHLSAKGMRSECLAEGTWGRGTYGYDVWEVALGTERVR